MELSEIKVGQTVEFKHLQKRDKGSDGLVYKVTSLDSPYRDTITTICIFIPESYNGNKFGEKTCLGKTLYPNIYCLIPAKPKKKLFVKDLLIP